MTLSIFISHSSKDVALAKALIELLRSGMDLSAHDVRCTTAEGHRLRLGSEIDNQLREEIKTATVFIALLTPISADSAYVLFELGARWGASLKIAPVLACGTAADALKGPLAHLNAITLGNSGHIYQFLEEVGQELKLTVANPSSYQNKISEVLRLASAPEPIKPPVKRRPLLLAGFAVLIAGMLYFVTHWSSTSSPSSSPAGAWKVKGSISMLPQKEGDEPPDPQRSVTLVCKPAWQDTGSGHFVATIAKQSATGDPVWPTLIFTADKYKSETVPTGDTERIAVDERNSILSIKKPIVLSPLPQPLNQPKTITAQEIPATPSH